jgi:hypothetical protein
LDDWDLDDESDKDHCFGRRPKFEDEKFKRNRKNKDSLYTSWITQSASNKVPKEFTIKEAKKSSPNSIYEAQN